MPMPCQKIQSWTFSGLVGAFLDLAIAYLLLCASTLAYLASKFLCLFGLSLPCPCNGLFLDPNRNKCLQELLVNRPSEKVYSVQCSVKGNFPFDSILTSDSGRVNGNLELEGETSCSLSPGRGEQGLRDVASVKQGRSEARGKGLASRRLRYGLRHRRKGALDRGKFGSAPLFDSLESDAQAVSLVPPNATAALVGDDTPERSSILVSPQDGREVSDDIGLQQRASGGFEIETTGYKNKRQEGTGSLSEQVNYNSTVDLHLESNTKNAVRVLEQALEEEHAAHVAVCLELEKERSAAATAADEAMAMILRLQEEKASIEMEARQYRRMVEEKSAYDAEEMNILKEILVRRETEKHFLEKEVETYRNMLFANEQLESDMQDTATIFGQGISSSYSSEDPMLILQRINDSINERERNNNVNTFSESEMTSIGAENYTCAFGKELPIPELEDSDSLKLGMIYEDSLIDENDQHLSSSNDGIDNKFKEKKGPVSVDKHPPNEETEIRSGKPKTNPTARQEQPEKSDSCISWLGLTSKTAQSCDGSKIVSLYDYDDMDNCRRDSKNSNRFIDSPVHDVHVVDDEVNKSLELREKQSEQLPVDVTLNISRAWPGPTMSKLKPRLENEETSSDITSRFLLRDGMRRKSLLSDMRRNSMSAVDYERSKIDNEVGRLQERLKAVQEGKQKLNFSVGHWERGKTQCQLLEEIADQLQEIRHLAAPGRAARQASMPVPPHKVWS